MRQIMVLVFLVACGGDDDSVVTVDAPAFEATTRYHPVTWTCLTGCTAGDILGYRQVEVGTFAGAPALGLSVTTFDYDPDIEVHPGTRIEMSGRPCIMVNDGPAIDYWHHGVYTWCDDAATSATSGSTDYMRTTEGNFSATAPIVR